MKSEPFADYLARRAAKGPWTLDLEIDKPLPGAIVIPALAEAASLRDLLDSLAADSTLPETGLAVVFVVNNRLDAACEEKEDNLATLNLLKYWRTKLSFPVGIVDAASAGLELPIKDGGVGLARKLGHDLLLPRLDFCSTDPVMVSLDVDTLVKSGYAGAIMAHFRSSAAGGAVIPFEHLQAEGERESRAIERYELFLRCYVAGLAFAGSPYAFHTVGSAMACRASAYLKCGGMNRRRAGEDFYFLQSLAKTSGIEQLKGTTVQPSPRRSTRVPFGTGRAMGMLLDGEPNSIRFYRPECYLILKAWLNAAINAPGGLIQSNADNAQMDWPGGGVYDNPWSVNNQTRDDHRLSNRLMNEMLPYNDPRVPVYAQPTLASATDPTAPDYAGMPNGLTATEAATYSLTTSRPGSVFYSNDAFCADCSTLPGANFPSFVLTYAEVSFILAEARERGWITSGTAAGYYEQGIRASMAQWGVTDQDAITAFLARPEIIYVPGTEGLRRIALQKWIALYTDGVEAWAEWRRTCVPATVVPGSAALINTVPRRYQYSTREQSVNGANVEAAIARQGPDEFTTRMYWDTNPTAAPTYPGPSCGVRAP